MRKKADDVRQPFQFGWEVPESGYRCERGSALDKELKESPKAEHLIEPTPVGVERIVRRYQTLKDNSALFLNFAKIDGTPEGIVAFANRYGTLGGDLRKMVRIGKAPLYAGEAIAAWVDEISLVRGLLPLWDPDSKSEITFRNTPESIDALWATGNAEHVVFRATDPDTYDRLKDNPSALAQHYLRAKVNEKLREHPSTGRLIYEKARGQLTLYIVPSSLIAAIWLQFAGAIDGNRRYRSCKNCRKWFEVGGSARRVDAEACSDSCKAAFAYREKQSRGKKRKRGTR